MKISKHDVVRVIREDLQVARGRLGTVVAIFEAGDNGTVLDVEFDNEMGSMELCLAISGNHIEQVAPLALGTDVRIAVVGFTSLPKGTRGTITAVLGPWCYRASFGEARHLTMHRTEVEPCMRDGDFKDELARRIAETQNEKLLLPLRTLLDACSTELW